MAKIKRFFRRFSWKKIVSIALAVLLSIAAIAGVSALVGYLKDDKKTIHPDFEVGGLLDTNGKYDINEKAAIYTEEAFSAKGLEIKLDFDSSVKYQVFFYDRLDNFISCTKVYDKSESISVPVDAYARIEVTPIWGDDGSESSISWYEVSGYAKQLEIRVDKEQVLKLNDFVSMEIPSDAFTVHTGYTVNQSGLVISESHVAYSLENDGSFSLAFLSYDASATFQPEGYVEPISPSIIVLLKDGTVYEMFSSHNFDLPTFDEPLCVPAGATIYVACHKDAVEHLNLRLYIL